MAPIDHTAETISVAKVQIEDIRRCFQQSDLKIDSREREDYIVLLDVAHNAVNGGAGNTENQSALLGAIATVMSRQKLCEEERFETRFRKMMKKHCRCTDLVEADGDGKYRFKDSVYKKSDSSITASWKNGISAKGPAAFIVAAIVGIGLLIYGTTWLQNRAHQEQIDQISRAVGANTELVK